VISFIAVLPFNPHWYDASRLQRYLAGVQWHTNMTGGGHDLETFIVIPIRRAQIAAGLIAEPGQDR
jgi:hypothetical protein